MPDAADPTHLYACHFPVHGVLANATPVTVGARLDADTGASS